MTPASSSGTPAASEPSATARARVERYDHAAIEQRWQQRWVDAGLYNTPTMTRSGPTATT